MDGADVYMIVQVGGLFFDALIGGVTCLLYLQSRRILKTLQNTKVIDLNGSLERLLKSSPNQRIDYVGVRGKIISLHNETKCLGSLPVRNILAVYNGIMKFVYQLILPSDQISQPPSFTHSLTLRSVKNSYLPFTVYIDNIPWRDTVTSRSDAYISVSDKWSNFREGFTEGMIVTIYGKVQRISPTEIRVQYSGTDDAPYIFTTLAPEELFHAQRQEISRHRLFFLLYSVVGALIFGRIVWKGVQRYREFARKHKLLRDLEGMKFGDMNSLNNEETHTLCIICKAKERNVIFSNCPHLSCCKECATQLEGKCPVCSEVSPHFKYPIFLA